MTRKSFTQSTQRACIIVLLGEQWWDGCSGGTWDMVQASIRSALNNFSNFPVDLPPSGLAFLHSSQSELFMYLFLFTYSKICSFWCLCILINAYSMTTLPSRYKIVPTLAKKYEGRLPLGSPLLPWLQPLAPTDLSSVPAVFLFQNVTEMESHRM